MVVGASIWNFHSNGSDNWKQGALFSSLVIMSAALFPAVEAAGDFCWSGDFSGFVLSFSGFVYDLWTGEHFSATVVAKKNLFERCDCI